MALAARGFLEVDRRAVPQAGPDSVHRERQPSDVLLAARGAALTAEARVVALVGNAAVGRATGRLGGSTGFRSGYPVRR
jgi:hypothetical protein